MPNDLVAEYAKFYEKTGHVLQGRYSLVHPAFKTSFVLSAGVIDMQHRLAGGHEGPSRCLLIQPCFRQFDAERLESGMHLSLFLMGAALYFDNPPRASVLEAMIRFLVAELRVPAQRLWLTTFGGGIVNGHCFAADEDSQKAWFALNMAKSQIVINGPEHNLWREGASSGEERSGLCGPHAEVFYDSGTSSRCDSKICLPGCGCGRFVEIGNAVFPQHRMTKTGLQEIPGMIAEAAMGLDRLAMILESAKTVFDTRALGSYTKNVADGPLAGTADTRLTFKLADHVRSFCCLVAEGANPGRSGRGQILRRLLKTCWSDLERGSSPPKSAITRAAEILHEHPEATAGIDLQAHWSRVSEILQTELAFIMAQRQKTPSS